MARVVELLEPDRIGHGVKAAYDPRAMAMIRERGIVLEICPTSNLNTRVVSGWDEFRWIFDTFRRNDVRFTINTDGPEMLKTYIRDELATARPARDPVLEDQQRAAETSLAASFVPNVSDVPAPRLEPARRVVVEREEGLRPSVRGAAHPVGAAAVAPDDVRLALDVRAEDLAEQLELGAAGRLGAGRHVVDRAVVLDDPDHPVRSEHRLGEVALLVLDHRELAGAVDHRRTGRQPFGEPLPDAFRGHPPARLEHLVDQRFAAHRPDRRQQAGGQPVVGAGKRSWACSVTSYTWRGRPTP